MSSADLRVIPLHALFKGSRWRVEAMRSYSVDQLIWFTRGQGRLTVGGLTRGYGAHNAVYIPAGTMHSFELTANVFGTAVFMAPDHDLPFPDHPCHLRIRDAADQAELTLILDNLQREVEGDHPARLRAAGYHAGLLTVWLERQMLNHEDALAEKTAARRLARRYSDMVEQRFHLHESVSDYAAQLGVTPTHLTRVCKESCGRTASDFLADRKIAEAQRLLADTRMPIKKIAEGLGFASAAYFTRAFQTRAGNTPMNFRKSSNIKAQNGTVKVS
ncbi:AraC family transcriptional regulator [Actibacterium atlanticum]|uniref:AraC family transcriptional regulator n=1 Tax=Actibacterium atlanticum TaxID=1461693 RepID=A0A058ZQN3_9RHOB|nr:AraC family transcriptional regulator [Actibacterium atlanticum]KCV83550.1 AraC family transcriptional regulator [Actibacterium atlanticum]